MNDNLVNHQITSQTVRLVDPDGGQLGIFSTREALNIAQDQYNLDLVMIAEKAEPPVCKITDYGKFKYHQTKKLKEAKKNAKASRIDTKQLWMRPGTDVHDVNIKLKHAKEFLEKGNRVKVGVKFRGRELQYKQKGTELLERFIEDLGVVGTDFQIDQAITPQERNITMVVSPVRNK